MCCKEHVASKDFGDMHDSVDSILCIVTILSAMVHFTTLLRFIYAIRLLCVQTL